MEVDSLIHARWLIPVEPSRITYENYSVAIKAGRIHKIMPTDEALNAFTCNQIIQLDEHVVIPGLINAHTHAPMNLFRGIADDLPLSTWLHEHIWPLEQKWVDGDFASDGTRLAIAEMLRGGVTCFNDMYFFPEKVAAVAAELGMRAVIGMIVLDFPTNWAHDAEEYLRKGQRIYDDYHKHPLIRMTLAPHAPYTVSSDVLSRIGVLAESLDVQIHIHVHETSTEIIQSVKEHHKRPLQRLFDLGISGPRLIAVHMTQLSAYEIDKLADLGVHIVHCPESNLKLASGFCPVTKLLESGVNVCIGTDGAASNNDLDMLSEMRTAALLAKGISQDSTSLDAYTTLQMATKNAALALGLEESIGSLIEGKQADISAIRLGDQLETIPVHDPVSQIIYASHRHQVTDVWVAGKRLLNGGVLTTIDQQALIENSKQWQMRLAGHFDH